MKSILRNLINDYVPWGTIKSSRNLPWITNEAKRSMIKRDRLFFELGNEIAIPTGHIFGNLGTLLLN